MLGNSPIGASPRGATTLSTAPVVPSGPDITSPQFSGSINVVSLVANAVSLSWPAATDNVGVAGYTYAIGDGDPINISTNSVDITGLQPETVYTINVRAYDTAMNMSVPLVVVITTPSEKVVQTGQLVVGANHPRAVYVAVSGFVKKLSTAFTSFAKPKATQDPSAVLDYVFDWTEYLAATNSTIVADEFFVTNASLLKYDFNTKQTAAWVQKGAVNHIATLTNRITTNDGRVDERSIQIKFKDL